MPEFGIGQSDLKEVGYFYSFLFLPSANLISYIALLAFVLGGPEKMIETLAYIQEALPWNL